ncbi:MAG: putative nucleotidyltransferase with HDIG domain [Bacteroidia bacterium]
MNFLRNRHEPVQRALLFVVAGLLIVWMLPKEGKFKYEYQKGKPWMHEDLIAPFDFAINKPFEEVELQRKLVDDKAGIYVSIDRSIIKEKNAELAEQLYDQMDLDTSKTRHRKKYNQHLEIAQRLLGELFRKGILQRHQAIDNMGEDQKLFLLNGNNATEIDVNDLHSVNSAYEFLQARLGDEDQLEKDILIGTLTELLEQNVSYDKETTQRLGAQEMSEVSTTRGMIAQAQSIIKRGDLVDDDRYQILESLRQETEKQLGSKESYLLLILGQLILVSVCLVSLFLFLVKYRANLAANNSNVMFILIMILMLVLGVSIIRKFPSLNVYVIPFCLLPVIIRNFFDSRIALFTYLISLIIVGYEVPNGYEFLFLQLIAGIIVLFTLINLSSRGQLFKSMVIVMGTYSLCYFSMAIMQEGSIQEVDARMFIWFAGSVGLTLFAYPLIYIFEKMFGMVSDVTMLELSNTNHVLLRELATEAPGTFQHSLQVANLAESAVYEIGGNALLVRTGALYHDIGKLHAPMFFIENQVTGVNPHDDLSFEESAKIIIGHVRKGVERAKAIGLPEQIIDFIRTHHGTTTVQYFYRSYLRDFPEGELDKEHFSYPGPKPFTKEMAVLMMADSVEAASRSLKEYTEENIENLIGAIIDNQMKEGQFNNADITFRDITVIKGIFKKKLMNAYHVRVEYPS